MQRGAHFVIFDVPFGAPCWAQRGCQKRCKINAFLLTFQMKGTPGAATKCIPKSKICKICTENEQILFVDPFGSDTKRYDMHYMCHSTSICNFGKKITRFQQVCAKIDENVDFDSKLRRALFEGIGIRYYEILQ